MRLGHKQLNIENLNNKFDVVISGYSLINLKQDRLLINPGSVGRRAEMLLLANMPGYQIASGKLRPRIVELVEPTRFTIDGEYRCINSTITTQIAME